MWGEKSLRGKRKAEDWTLLPHSHLDTSKQTFPSLPSLLPYIHPLVIQNLRRVKSKPPQPSPSSFLYCSKGRREEYKFEEKLGPVHNYFSPVTKESQWVPSPPVGQAREDEGTKLHLLDVRAENPARAPSPPQQLVKGSALYWHLQKLKTTPTLVITFYATRGRFKCFKNKYKPNKI